MAELVRFYGIDPYVLWHQTPQWFWDILVEQIASLRAEEILNAAQATLLTVMDKKDISKSLARFESAAYGDIRMLRNSRRAAAHKLMKTMQSTAGRPEDYDPEKAAEWARSIGAETE